MIFDSNDGTTIVFQEKANLSLFLRNLKDNYSQIKNDNIVVNLFSFSKLKADDVWEFLQISDTHKKSGKSFVLVTDKVAYDEVPDEICLVPTIQEAHDIIEMEEIERDLDL